MFHPVEASFTGQVGGFGLGLAFAKLVAQYHGGALRIDSHLGRGTTVTLSILQR